MAKRIKKLYVTKYWQTQGIVRRKCRPGVLSGYWQDDEWAMTYYMLGRNAFETEEEARAAVQAAARKKVESLRRQADKIEGTWLASQRSACRAQADKIEQKALAIAGEHWPWAVRQMRQGRRVRRLSWSAGEYIYSLERCARKRTRCQ